MFWKILFSIIDNYCFYLIYYISLFNYYFSCLQWFLSPICCFLICVVTFLFGALFCVWNQPLVSVIHFLFQNCHHTGKAQFVKGRTGGYVLIYGGYSYSQHNVTRYKKHWRCSKGNCLGRVHTMGEDVQVIAAHNHSPNSFYLEGQT